MGMVIDGKWSDEDRTIEDGAFKRAPSQFAQEIPHEIVNGLRAESGRYHLIASMSCPWSQRAILARQLKGLVADTPLHLAGGERIEGYPANGGDPWCIPGTDREIVHLHELYTLSQPDYTGRVTVPILWDSQTLRIVSNESARIMRAFDASPDPDGLDYTLVPEALSTAIDTLNLQLQEGLSNATYRAGFAESQAAYDTAVRDVFSTLDGLEARLATQRFLHGPVITESDWRLFPSLVRFDIIYYLFSRCTLRRLVDYPHLWAYARDLFSWPGVADTVDFDTIRRAAYVDDPENNPFGILAIAPDIDWRALHGRERLGPVQVATRTGDRRTVEPVSGTTT